MKLLLIPLILALSSCKNLSPEQNDRLLGVGLRVGESLLVKATK